MDGNLFSVHEPADAVIHRQLVREPVQRENIANPVGIDIRRRYSAHRYIRKKCRSGFEGTIRLTEQDASAGACFSVEENVLPLVIVQIHNAALFCNCGERDTVLFECVRTHTGAA